MNAATLNCPSCGAAVSSDAPNCLFCKSLLATVACPACFGLMFRGQSHCQHCGARADRKENAATAHKCPRCRVELGHTTVGETDLRDCPNCAGLWLEKESFDRICANGEQQAAVLGFGAAAVHPVAPAKVNYVPCPECGELMNRANFARYSGVIVDVCREHGTWFDADELRQVVEFIRQGGLDQARSREKEKLAEERRALAQERLIASRRDSFHGRGNPVGFEERQLLAADLVRGLTKFFIR
jgi:Zn-finger nucleic acid-binding protein